jgi:hypothetical protein
MTNATHEATGPARVRGNERTAIAVFIEDERGELVDIEYVCEDNERGIGALPWPAFDFGDSDIYCSDCGALINIAPRA